MSENEIQTVETERYEDNETTTTSVSAAIDLHVEIDEIEVEVVDEEWTLTGKNQLAKEELESLINEQGIEVLDLDHVHLKTVQTAEPY